MSNDLDICSPAGAVPSPALVLAGSRFAPYWSNADGGLPAARRRVPAASARRARTRRAPDGPDVDLDHAGPWRKLRAVDLRFLRGERQVGLVRLTDDASKTGRLSARGSLVDPDPSRTR